MIPRYHPSGRSELRFRRLCRSSRLPCGHVEEDSGIEFACAASWCAGALVRLDDGDPEKVLASATLVDDGSGCIDVRFSDGSADVADSLTYVDVWA